MKKQDDKEGQGNLNNAIANWMNWVHGRESEEPSADGSSADLTEIAS